MRINCKIIPSGHATVVREYARGNLDEAELSTELSALGFNSTEIEWHIANPGKCSALRGSQMDEELKSFFSAQLNSFHWNARERHCDG